MYCYFALVKIDETEAGGIASEAQVWLEAEGLEKSFTCGPITLYTSKATPVLPLSNGAVIIGHLFSHDGAPADSAHPPTDLPRGSAVGAHILKHFWGEYLLVEPMLDDVRSWKVTRDPSGGVPCVHSFRRGVGFITSDISLAKRLGFYKTQVDWNYLATSLVYPHKTGRTGLMDVRELLPGCSINFSNGQISEAIEWTPWDVVTSANRYSDPNDAAAEVRRVIQSAVKAFAMTDRSILLELSGGLDSSIVAACLKDAPARLACCTLKTPVPGADERRYARQMADVLGVPLEVVEMRFDDGRFDFPVPANSVAPGIGALQHATNAAKERVGDRLGVTSYFSGGGGDTIFSYLSNTAPAADAYRQHGLVAGMSAVKNLSELHQCTLWTAARLTVKKLRNPPKLPYKPDPTFLAQEDTTVEDHPWHAAPAGSLDGDRDRIFDLVNTQLFKDGSARSVNRFLRMPLLSQPVVETCLRIPSWMWIAHGRNRSVVRTAFADVLPQDIIDRRSKGTYVNYSGVLYRKNKQRMLDYLLTGRLQAQQLLDTAALRRFVAAEPPPRDHTFMRIFDLCMVENWVRQQA